MRRLDRENIRRLVFSSYDRIGSANGPAYLMAAFVDEPFEIQELRRRQVFPEGGYVYLGDYGLPCAQSKEKFESMYRLRFYVKQESGEKKAGGASGDQSNVCKTDIGPTVPETEES